VLTVALVSAFGFLANAPAPITVNGSFLRVPEGQTLSLIGGDITLTNAALYAPAGRINLASVGSAGEVIPTDADLTMQGFGKLGAITVEHPSTDHPKIDLGKPFGEVSLGDVDTSSAGGGAIFIRSGQWVSRRGWVLADTYGDRDGRGGDMVLTGAARFESGSRLNARTRCTGHGARRQYHPNRP
jgi:hypothetical protein